MSAITISVPSWGERYVDLTTRFVLPALVAAYRYYPVEFDLVVHTDQAAAIQACWRKIRCGLSRLILKPNFPGRKYTALAASHREVITEAPQGTAIVLLNADVIPSRELFSVITRTIANGKKALAGTGIRIKAEDAVPFEWVSAEQLLAYGWEHRHRVMEERVWGRGITALPTGLIFEEAGHVTTHCFHMHPVMILKDRNLTFTSTIDFDLLECCYNADEIRYLTDKEVGFVELSPPDRAYPVGERPLSVAEVVTYGATHFTRRQVEQFKQPISLVGSGWTDWATVDQIVEGIKAAQSRPSAA